MLLYFLDVFGKSLEQNCSRKEKGKKKPLLGSGGCQIIHHLSCPEEIMKIIQQGLLASGSS